ncbi:hypothetical protein J6590_003482 [Homalodisca vitripennis]|nr:hypothetical protein J6590_003482 [Homalodisca vitripennis]
MQYWCYGYDEREDSVTFTRDFVTGVQCRDRCLTRRHAGRHTTCRTDKRPYPTLTNESRLLTFASSFNDFGNMSGQDQPDPLCKAIHLIKRRPRCLPSAIYDRPSYLCADILLKSHAVHFLQTRKKPRALCGVQLERSIKPDIDIRVNETINIQEPLSDLIVLGLLSLSSVKHVARHTLLEYYMKLITVTCGGSEVTFKPLVPRLSVREGFLALTSPGVSDVELMRGFVMSFFVLRHLTVAFDCLKQHQISDAARVHSFKRRDMEIYRMRSTEEWFTKLFITESEAARHTTLPSALPVTIGKSVSGIVGLQYSLLQSQCSLLVDAPSIMHTSLSSQESSLSTATSLTVTSSTIHNSRPPSGHEYANIS